MRQLDQEWYRSAQAQLERLDVPALLSLLYKTVEHDLGDAPDKAGTSLDVGQTRFTDGRLEWSVTIFSKHGYTSHWSSSLKDSLVAMLMHYQVVAWGKNK